MNIIKSIYNNINNVIIKTPCEYNKRLSLKYGANIYLKREDLQITRSFKIRGVSNKINSLSKKELDYGIICASAGNHAQGFAYSCNKFNINGTIYVPKTTPLQKVNRIKYYGGNNIKINTVGDTFDDSLKHAYIQSCKTNETMVHPFDDYDVILGQSTIAYEIYQELEPDIILCPVGGGGLISGITEYSKIYNKNVDIIGVEPDKANSLTMALDNSGPIYINNIDKFVDGASVSIIGNTNYNILKNNIKKTICINNGKLCNSIIDLYENDGIITEPAGALVVAALDELCEKDNHINKNIVCIISGGNNDLTRYAEIMELNSIYLNLRHYFIIEFSQTPGQLKLFINNILGEKDDIIRFEYIKKTNKNFGNVLIGIELENPDNLEHILTNFDKHLFSYKKINYDDLLYDYLV